MFCKECLETMRHYPVKPGTPVHIPVRPEPAERKQVRSRKERTPDEQIAALHKQVRWLMILAAALAVALTVALGGLIYTLSDAPDVQPTEPPGGRNYTAAAAADTP